MRRSIGYLAALAICLCPWHGLRAQESSGIIYAKYRHFRIPFQAGPGKDRLKQVRLFVSEDQGRTWQPYSVAPPDQHDFDFNTGEDGYYWFAVQTLDVNGNWFPVTMVGVEPSLKVIVDSEPPVVTLQPQKPLAGQVGVAWQVQDANADLSLPDAIRVEYRRPGSSTWMKVPHNPSASRIFWYPGTNGAVDVRVKARDRAGNWGEATTRVSLSGQPQEQKPQDQNWNLGSPSNRIANAPGFDKRNLVNSTKINLNYELKEVGPSGVSQIDLWYTTDGRSWNKYPTDKGAKPGEKMVFAVEGEGIYGITLVAKSGVGLGTRPPEIGDVPQIWVEVDTTEPVTQILNVDVGRGIHKGQMTINWSARDKNLADNPITLTYAEKSEGPWSTIADKLENSGRYVWHMPQDVPYQFFVRVEAVDRAGNTGQAVTNDLVKVDLSQPKVNILQVTPGGS